MGWTRKSDENDRGFTTSAAARLIFRVCWRVGAGVCGGEVGRTADTHLGPAMISTSESVELVDWANSKKEEQHRLGAKRPPMAAAKRLKEAAEERPRSEAFSQMIETENQPAVRPPQAPSGPIHMQVEADPHPVGNN